VTRQDKRAVIFLSVVTVLAGLALLLPDVRQRLPTTGFFGLLGLPIWALMAAIMIACVGGIVIILVSARRKRR